MGNRLVAVLDRWLHLVAEWGCWWPYFCMGWVRGFASIPGCNREVSALRRWLFTQVLL